MDLEPPRARTAPRRVGHLGNLEVFVADEQDVVEVDTKRHADLARFVLEAESVRGDVELGLLFVDESTMSSLNRKHMDATGPTDVLAFPIDDEIFRVGRSPDGASRRPRGRDLITDARPWLLGDVVVCPAVAERQAGANVGSDPGHDGTVTAEIDLLVVHGILHVLGHDHRAADERSVMETAERQHLSDFREQQPSGTVRRSSWR